MTDPVANNEETGVEGEVMEPELPDLGTEVEEGVDAPTSESEGGGSADVQQRGDGLGVADASELEGEPTSADRLSEDATELVALREEFEALNDRHLRLVAEFNNFKRRSEQERLGAWARAQADLVEKLLDVLDDLQRVAELDLENATVEAIMEGIDLVERKFVRTLTDADVEVIDPTGQPFDPELMDAMMRVPPESDEQLDTVAQVFQKGYSLKGILVRPARVSVYTQG